MRTKLLLPFLCATVASFAQNIPGFYSPQAPTVYYDVVIPATPIDQSATGENLTWNFNSLTIVGASTTQTYASATAEFPNTTALVRTESSINGQETVNDIYLTQPESGSAITGVTFGDAVLSYSDNGFIGAFPLNYGYNNEDAVEGTFTGFGAEGTFTGTATVQVDAYGSFTASVGVVPANTTVTRLKITQNLQFAAGFLQLGSATQTINSYYSSQSTTDPVFRTITTSLNLPLIGVNDTTTSYEILGVVMSTNQFSENKTIIAPNPVADVLHFSGEAKVTGVTITDLAGRIVLQSNAANDISVSHLSAGIYNVAVQQTSGVSNQKIIKQ